MKKRTQRPKTATTLSNSALAQIRGGANVVEYAQTPALVAIKSLGPRV